MRSESMTPKSVSKAHRVRECQPFTGPGAQATADMAEGLSTLNYLLTTFLTKTPLSLCTLKKYNP